MTKKLALLVVLAFGAVGVARAEGPDPIETRQAGQDLLSSTFGGIQTAVAAKGDVTKLEFPAKAMARWMRQFPTQFPKGSDQGHNTKATAAIWTDTAGFEKAATVFAQASDKLAVLAKAGDADGFEAQVKTVGDACGACHRGYRAR
jgi:cytochrome c556